MAENIEEIIKQAHELYGETSIYEVIDADRDTAILRMSVYYGLPDMEKLERYFALLDIIRASETRRSRSNTIPDCPSGYYPWHKI